MVNYYLKIIKSFFRIIIYKFSNVSISLSSYLGSNVKIGSGTNINGKCFLSTNANSSIIIGKWCAIAHNLRIRTSNHSLDYINIQAKLQVIVTGINKHEISKGNVIIGNNVWIGDNVIILPGVKIGDGAVIGAGSIVTKNVEPFSIYAGSPAKFIRFRFNTDVINFLLDLKWWNWNVSRIKENHRLFDLNLNSVSLQEIKNIII